MKKLSLTTLALAICLSVFADNIVIQLGAFDKAVNVNTYFEGLNNVKMMVDRNNFYIYYVDGFSSESQAASQVYEYQSQGFNAQVIDMEAIMRCKQSCGQPQPHYYDEVKTTTFTLAAASPCGYLPKEKQDFERVRIVMLNNPNARLVMGGKTNMVGQIQCYLNTRGVANCNIDVQPTTNCTEANSGASIWVYNSANELIDIEAEFRRITRSGPATYISSTPSTTTSSIYTMNR